MGGRAAGRRPAREVADDWRRTRKTATDSPGDASASAGSWFPEGEQVRHLPGRGSKAALAAALAALARDPAGAGPAGVGPLGAVVDCVVAARRLAGWSLWVELAGLAQLIAFWEAHPPLDQDVLAPPTPLHPDDVDHGCGGASGVGGRSGCAGDFDYGDGADRERSATDLANPDLADRLASLVIGLQLPADIRLGDLAELFVTSELSAATGASRTATGQRVDAARALFLDDRLPRTRTLLRAGLLDWTKLRTLLVGTADLHPDTARAVEARVIPDSDLALAHLDPLDVMADPARPGATLPGVARMTNPALDRALRAAIAAIDAAALTERATRARARRHVRGYPIEDSMARLEIEAAQEAVAAVLNDLDATVAAAKAAGDTRTPDQIRTDTAITRLTRGAHGTAGSPGGPGSPQHQSSPSEPGEHDDEPADASDQRERNTADRPDVSADEADLVDADGSGTTASSSSEWRDPGPERSRCACPGGQPDRAAPGLAVSLTMTLSTWLGLAEDPAVLDRFGAIPAALARQIAREAARDHPTTTTWRCVITGDDHRSVLAVADPMRTPHHDPPPRLARLVDTIHPRCVFPGCAMTARRCDHDHRVAFETGGATCSCNLQPLCRGHHRLKSAGLITVHPTGDLTGNADHADGMDASGAATDTLVLATASGRSYRYDAPAPVPDPNDPHDQALATARHLQRQRENKRAGSADGSADGGELDPDTDITRGEDLTWRDLVGPHAAAHRTSGGTGRDTRRVTGHDSRNSNDGHGDGDGDTARHDAEHLSRPPQPPPF